MLNLHLCCNFYATKNIHANRYMPYSWVIFVTQFLDFHMLMIHAVPSYATPCYAVLGYARPSHATMSYARPSYATIFMPISTICPSRL